MYKLTASGSVQRLADGATIPNDPSNRDYADYLAWVKQGNVAQPMDVVEVTEETPIEAPLGVSVEKVTKALADPTIPQWFKDFIS
jgi:hypothetical protein